MKKYLILFIVLSLVVILPVAYPRWLKARREKQINAVITKARHVQGTALSDILVNMNSAEGNKIIILYTGNTQSYLEPYGYYKGRSGGVVRRAAVIEGMRKAGASPLVLDAGEMFTGATPLDQKKSETYLKAMNMMGYDAACISADEFRFGTEYLQEQMRQSKFPFLSANILDQDNKGSFAEPFVIKDLGDTKVAVAGISNIASDQSNLNSGIIGQRPDIALRECIEKLNKEADIIILLSNLSVSETKKIADELKGVDVVISSKNGESETQRNPIICCSEPYGKTIGMLSLSLDGHGSIISSTVQSISMQDENLNKPDIEELVSGFYQQAASNIDFQDTGIQSFASELLEQDSDNAYIGASGCSSCHDKEYEHWSTTPHASAFNSLVRMQRESYPGCVVCHVTGFSYETGYKIDKPNNELKSVSCETCHGPGADHSFAPTKENIRGRISMDICIQCHTEEYSPGFSEIAHLAIPKVNHSQKSVSIKEMLKERTASLLSPSVDLFVMSYCPFAIAAEEKLFPILKGFGDKVDFNIYFIADEDKEGKGTEDAVGSIASIASQFKSLHGQTEVIEDIRQLVIAKYYNDKLMNYILERNKDIKGNWVDCAKKLGIDPKKIQIAMESEEGVKLFKDNIKRSKELDIKGSPTIMVDSIKLSSKILYATGAKGGLCGK